MSTYGQSESSNEHGDNPEDGQAGEPNSWDDGFTNGDVEESGDESPLTKEHR